MLFNVICIVYIHFVHFFNRNRTGDVIAENKVKHSKPSLHIYKHEPYKADADADELVPRQGLFEEYPADEDECRRQYRTLYDACGAYLPACFICVDITYFQTNNNDSQHKRCPVKLSVLTKKRFSVITENKKQKKRNSSLLKKPLPIQI